MEVMVEGHNAARGQAVGRRLAEQDGELYGEAGDPSGGGELSNGEDHGDVSQ